MSNWKEYKLDDIVEITSSKRIMRSEYQEQGIPFFRSKEIIELNSGNDITTELFISKDRFLEINQKFGAPNYGDILLTSVGTLGVPYFVNYKENFYFKDGNLTWFRKFNNILRSKYLYYWLSSPIGKKSLKEITIGSTQPALTIAGLKSLTVKIPSLEEQDNIIEILDNLSNKIQLNTQINQTLEQIAQGIFKSWFVDFDPVRAKADALADGKTQAEAELAAQQIISGKTPEELTALSQLHPDRYSELEEIARAFPSEFEEIDGFGEVPRGWGKTTLSEICEMQNGYAFKSSDWTENGIPVIKIGSIKPIIVEVEGNGFVSNEYQNLRPDFLLTSGDILVGLTGYVGEVGRIPQGKVAMLNQRVAKFLPKEIDKNHNFYNYIYCLARQKQFKEFAEMNSKGSAQANISTKELLKFPIIRANKECHILFENKIQAILEKILVNSQNSEELASVRDLLLPRLLNGKIQL